MSTLDWQETRTCSTCLAPRKYYDATRCRDCMAKDPDIQALRHMIEEHSAAFIRAHGRISDRAVERVATIIASLDKRYSPTTPADGDAIIAYGQNVVYKKAHLQIGNHGLTMCMRPCTPFINDEAKCNASGGRWQALKADELEYIGLVDKLFWTWGCSPTAEGGINFVASVAQWKYENDKIY